MEQLKQDMAIMKEAELSIEARVKAIEASLASMVARDKGADKKLEWMTRQIEALKDGHSKILGIVGPFLCKMDGRIDYVDSQMDKVLALLDGLTERVPSEPSATLPAALSASLPASPAFPEKETS